MTTQASNVTPIGSKQPTPQTKFTIQATLDGFPIVLEGEGRAGDLRLIIDRLTSIGPGPPRARHTRERMRRPPPICPTHSPPMKASRKPGSFFCPRRTDEGSFCPEKA